LDEIQAAVLRAKLPHVDGWNTARRGLAALYGEALDGLPVQLPPCAPWATSNAHLYPVRTARRDALQAHLSAAGVQTLMHYPVPVHRQPAYAALGYCAGDFPVAEAACASVLSLPLYPELAPADVGEVAAAIGGFFT